MNHPKSDKNGMIYRFNPFKNQWEFWYSGFDAWTQSQYSMDYNPSHPVIEYKYTWCEPFEGMDDESTK